MASLIDTLIDVLGQEDAEYKSYPITRQRQLSVRILSGYRIFWFRNRHVLMPLINWNSSVWKM